VIDVLADFAAGPIGKRRRELPVLVAKEWPFQVRE